MKKSHEILTISAISLILLAVFTPMSAILPVSAQPNARLTNRIFDYGTDTDGDSLLNYLVVNVEVDVYESGTYEVRIDALLNSFYSPLYVNVRNETHLNAGPQNVSVPINGIAIYGGKLNPAYAKGISLSYYVGSSHYMMTVYQLPLSRTYNYTEFDMGAVLTGVIVDEGVDTDGDGLFNSLEVGVEVNVTDYAMYEVYVTNLVDVFGYQHTEIYVSNSTTSFLFPGTQLLNVSLYGPPIHASHGDNISLVSFIEFYLLEDYKLYTLNNSHNLPLTGSYSYVEFETPAYLTRTILDEGVDSDGDSLFENLKISIEINVTEAGNYDVRVVNLADNASHYIYTWETMSAYFDVGVHLANVTIYGPEIYLSHVNPMYVVEVDIINGWTLDSLHGLPLPTPYDYDDFDPHALLTGRISDMGIDTDGDMLYDYLAVGIEVNVTEAGTYRISADKLVEQQDGTWKELSYSYKSVENYFGVGNHTVYLNYSGPMLAYNRFSPTNVTDIRLSETVEPYLQLGYINSARLSRKYNCTLFPAPLKDVQINLVIYPNATMDINGTLNSTNIYPPMEGPKFNVTAGFSTNGNTTTGSAKGTMTFPAETLPEWPFNSTTAQFQAGVQDDMLNAQFNLSMLMPPAGLDATPFNSTSGDFTMITNYSNGLAEIHLYGAGALSPDMASEFPFNVSDMSVLVSYLNKRYNGSIIFRVAGGFPLGDVVANLEGNETDLSLTGSVNVTYGSFFGNPIGEENVTQLISYLANLTGTGEQSLYNLTEGMIEFVDLNATRTPESWGEIVDYNATFSGNFTAGLSRLIVELLGGTGETEQTIYAGLKAAFSSVQNGTLQLNYYKASKIVDFDLTLYSDVKKLWNDAVQLIPSTVPEEARTQVEAMLKICNATAYGIENAHVQAEYSGDLQKLDLTFSLTANITHLRDEMAELIPQAMSPQLQPLFESFFNVTYCKLDSLSVVGNFTKGIAAFEADWTLKGDFKAQINHMKRFYIDYINATSPYMINWGMRLFNITELDVNNLTIDLKQGEDWMTMTFSGARIDPLKDEVDPLRFTLYRWLNTTSDPEAPPQDFEKLRVTITGGFNGTHTILLYAPGTVPAHTTALDYKTMIWDNASMSSLRDLLFQIAYQGVINYLGTYYVPVFTNSTVTNFGFDPSAKQIHFNVTGASGTGFCNITIPRALLYAGPSEWTVRLDTRVLNSSEFNVTENAGYVFIYLNYTHSDHLIVIQGKTVVSEFSPQVLPFVLLILSLVTTIVAIKQRRKLNLLRIKCQAAIYAFASRTYNSKS
jgi:hypothetical protein